jgi:phosphoribosylglycinamide formyltransferase-1
VILQRAVALPDAREPEEVLAALRPLEHGLLGEAVRLLARGALRADPANPRRQIIDPTARRQGEG